MKISQREAQRLKKRVAELERRESANRYAWSRDWVGGVQIATEALVGNTASLIRLSRKLGHAVVCTADRNDVRFYAVKP